MTPIPPITGRKDVKPVGARRVETGGGGARLCKETTGGTGEGEVEDGREDAEVEEGEDATVVDGMAGLSDQKYDVACSC